MGGGLNGGGYWSGSGSGSGLVFANGESQMQRRNPGNRKTNSKKASTRTLPRTRGLVCFVRPILLSVLAVLPLNAYFKEGAKPSNKPYKPLTNPQQKDAAAGILPSTSHDVPGKPSLPDARSMVRCAC